MQTTDNDLLLFDIKKSPSLDHEMTEIQINTVLFN